MTKLLLLLALGQTLDVHDGGIIYETGARGQVPLLQSGQYPLMGGGSLYVGPFIQAVDAGYYETRGHRSCWALPSTETWCREQPQANWTPAGGPVYSVTQSNLLYYGQQCETRDAGMRVECSDVVTECKVGGRWQTCP